MERTINTRYDFGDEVWTLDGDKACHFAVEAITLRITPISRSILYGAAGVYPVSEDKCFPTKDALSDYIFSNIGTDEEQNV